MNCEIKLGNAFEQQLRIISEQGVRKNYHLSDKQIYKLNALRLTIIHGFAKFFHKKRYQVHQSQEWEVRCKHVFPLRFITGKKLIH